MLGSKISFFRSVSISAFDIARALLFLNIVAITFSPALVNLVELLLIATVAGSSSLRTQIAITCKKYMPMRFLVGFVAWILVATTWGDAPVAERVQEIISWRKLLLFPLVLALVSDVFRRNMLILIAIVGVLYSAAAWVSAIGKNASVPEVFMRSDVVQTIYLALSTFAVLSLVGLYRSKASWLMNLFSGLALALLIFTILHSTGRSGHLLLVVGVCCFSMLCLKRNKLMIAGGLCSLVIGLLLIIPGPSQEFKRGIDEVIAVTDPAKDPEISSMGIRVVMWYHTIEMIKNKPFFGSGAGSFESDYANIAESRSSGWRADRSNDPHQQYLHIAAEYGLIGLFLLLLFIGSLLHRLRINFFSIFGITVLFGLLATSFFSGHLSSLVEGRLFWILVPLFLSTSLSQEQPV